MTQHKNKDSVFNSIQMETSKEASPLLEFIVRNSRKIILLVVLFILVIAGTGIWAYMEEQAHMESNEDLGKILVMMVDGPEKTAALQEFLSNSPATLKTPALLALSKSASASQDHALAADSWAQVAANNKNNAIYHVAIIGQTNELVLAEKSAEAMAILEKELVGANEGVFITISAQAANIAESMGDIQKAIDLTKGIIGKSASMQNRDDWEQKLSYLNQQLK